MLLDANSPCGWSQGTSLCLMNSIYNRERQWQKVIPEEANGTADQRKTTETEARSTLATVNACTTSRRLIPAIFGCQPIKLQLYPHTHTHPAK